MKHPFGPTLGVIILFTLAQLAGLLILHAYFPVSTGPLKDLPSVAGVVLDRPEMAPSEGVAFTVIAIVIGTLLLLGLIRFRATWLWRIWYFVTVVLLLHIALGAILRPSLSLPIAIVLAWAKPKHTVLHNGVEILLYGGIAAIFVPLLTTPLAALALLILISIYDMIAVWKTKHMITLAKFQIEQKTFGGIMIPYTPHATIAKHKTSTKKTASAQHAILGGGDIAFPLLFLGTLLYTKGASASLIALPFIVIALTLMLTLAKKGRFYPAMPFLTAGCLFGFAITLLA